MVPGENEQSIRSFLRLLQLEPAIVSNCLNSVDKTVSDIVNIKFLLKIVAVADKNLNGGGKDFCKLQIQIGGKCDKGMAPKLLPLPILGLSILHFTHILKCRWGAFEKFL